MINEEQFAYAQKNKKKIKRYKKIRSSGIVAIFVSVGLLTFCVGAASKTDNITSNQASALYEEIKADNTNTLTNSTIENIINSYESGNMSYEGLIDFLKRKDVLDSIYSQAQEQNNQKVVELIDEFNDNLTTYGIVSASLLLLAAAGFVTGYHTIKHANAGIEQTQNLLDKAKYIMDYCDEEQNECKGNEDCDGNDKTEMELEK